MIGEHETVELSKIAKSIEPKPIGAENENAFTHYRKEFLKRLKDPAGQLSPALQVYCDAINSKYDLDDDERKLFALICVASLGETWNHSRWKNLGDFPLLPPHSAVR